MKLTKLMLSASVAALALVSCNKQDTTPQEPVRLKTVEVSLANVILTKGVVEDAVKEGDKVVVNNFQIFLLDAQGNEYTGKTVDGAVDAQSYWDSSLPSAASFHYVDPNCTKVVAVANMGDKFESYAALKAALQTKPLEIGLQQNPMNLALYAEDSDFEPTTAHNDKGADNVVYQQSAYKVELLLKPRISRFEVDGFSVKFKDPANPKYNEIKVTQLAFQGYYPNTDLLTGVESGALVQPITDFANQAAVYTWLDTPDASPNPWYRDAVDLTITPAAAVKDLPADGKLAYHMFSCANQVPVFVIKLIVDGQPAYLYTKNLKDANGEPVTNFQEGYIYRMNAAGQVANNGTIEIPEEKIDPMDRCLDITVDVMSWKVTLVTPEF